MSYCENQRFGQRTRFGANLVVHETHSNDPKPIQKINNVSHFVGCVELPILLYIGWRRPETSKLQSLSHIFCLYPFLNKNICFRKIESPKNIKKYDHAPVRDSPKVEMEQSTENHKTQISLQNLEGYSIDLDSFNCLGDSQCYF